MHYAMCTSDLFGGIDDLYYGYDPQNGAVFYIGFESPALLYPHCVLTHLCNQNIEQQIKSGTIEKTALYGTDFQHKVWKALCDIPSGQTVSYKDIAQKIGNSKAMRAVGSAIGRNPISIFIPCHRVITSNGGLGGYLWGLDIKSKLLEKEALL
jgi:O-6-methylguanine DNA methyltransferase